MRLHLTLICLLLGFNTLCSQTFKKGEAVLSNGEKLSGFFSVDFKNQNSVYYKITLEGETDHLEAEKTRHIALEGVRSYVSKLVFDKGDSSYIFAKAIVTGKYSLYEGFRLNRQGDKDYIYVAEKDDRLHIIPRIASINFFKKLYGDCAVSGMSELKRVKIFCAEVTVNANKCDSSEYKTDIKTLPTGIQFGVKAGYNSWEGTPGSQTSSGLIKDISARGYFLGLNGMFVINNKFFVELGTNYRVGSGENTFVQVGNVNQPIETLSDDIKMTNNHLSAGAFVGWMAKINSNNQFLIKLGIDSRLSGRAAKTYIVTPRTPYPNRNIFAVVDESVRFGGEIAYRKRIKEKQFCDILLGFYFAKPHSTAYYSNMLTLGLNYIIDKTTKSRIL